MLPLTSVSDSAFSQGVAEGSGVPLYEVLYDGFSRTDGGSDGCASFALTSEKTGGQLLLGQNWDRLPEVKGALVASKGEVSVLGFTEAGLFGPKLGLNSAGLGLVKTASRAPTGRGSASPFTPTARTC